MVVAVNIAYAKSRLGPTKQLTIPRPELTGVIIGVRKVRLQISQNYSWSDSKCERKTFFFSRDAHMFSNS